MDTDKNADPRDGLQSLPANLREPVQLLRERLANDEPAWRALCVVMQHLAHARPEAVDCKAALQAAVDGIEVPKMTAARAEYYKAGARAAIAAMNAAVAKESAP